MAKLLDIIRRELGEGGGVSESSRNRPEREVVRALAMLTHDGDVLVRQRACLNLGEMVSKTPPERIKNYLRRLLWRMSPESGDYPIGAPELFGEIGRGAPQYVDDFVGAFLFYLDDEKLRAGLLQAAGRIGREKPEAVGPHVERISGYLFDDNPAVAGNAALALCRIGGGHADRARQTLANDARNVRLFRDDAFMETSLRELVERVNELLEGFCFVTNIDEN